MRYFPTLKAAFTKTLKLPASGDISGVVVPRGAVLDLLGKTFKASKSLTCYGAVINGRIDFSGDKFSAAINIPDTYKNSKGKQVPNTGCLVEGILVQGDSYNGLAKVWGESAVVANCRVWEGTGWGVQLWESHGTIIDAVYTKNLRRGGIYIGKDEKDENGVESRNNIIQNCVLDGADEESPLRVNTAVNVIIRNNFVNNTRSKSRKEALQLRGFSGSVYQNVLLSSTSSGQQPNGMTTKAAFTLTRNLIMGYNSIEAGGDVTFDRCYLYNQLVMSGSMLLELAKKIGIPASVISQVAGSNEYTIPKIGNGAAVNAQTAARGLPDGKAAMLYCYVTSRGGVTKTQKRVRESGTIVV